MNGAHTVFTEFGELRGCAVACRRNLDLTRMLSDFIDNLVGVLVELVNSEQRSIEFAARLLLFFRPRIVGAILNVGRAFFADVGKGIRVKVEIFSNFSKKGVVALFRVGLGWIGHDS